MSCLYLSHQVFLGPQLRLQKQFKAHLYFLPNSTYLSQKACRYYKIMALWNKLLLKRDSILSLCLWDVNILPSLHQEGLIWVIPWHVNLRELTISEGKKRGIIFETDKWKIIIVFYTNINKNLWPPEQTILIYFISQKHA